MRWVDDMVFYAESQGAAEEALGFYEEGLSHFELALNPLKTSIVPGIRPYVDEWLIRLRKARYRDNSESHQADDVVDLFSLAFELHPRFPNSGVVSYAIKRCNPFPAGDAWKVYEELVLTSMTLESSSIRHAFDVLTYAAAIGLQLNTQLIETACNTLILRHAPLGHGYDVRARAKKYATRPLAARPTEPAAVLVHLAGTPGGLLGGTLLAGLAWVIARRNQLASGLTASGADV